MHRHMDIAGGSKIHRRACLCWKSMFKRCYSPSSLAARPTYVGCSVTDTWTKFSSFLSWYSENFVDGYELDKDILVPGNKIYGPNTCAFVPKELNLILGDSAAARGQQPTGVSLIKRTGRFRAYMMVGQKQKHLGVYTTAGLAATAYARAKATHIKQVAVDMFLANKIKTDVYMALMQRARRLVEG